MNESDLMYSSKEDQLFYLKCVEGLPTLAGLNGTGKDADGIPLPYGLGAHSVRCLREIVEIVKPAYILEISFNMGYSAALWLELSNANLVSCDVSYKKETLVAAEILEERYPERFFYKHRGKINHVEDLYDLNFIDGSHLLENIILDIELSILLKIPFIAMDDWLPQFGQVQEAVASFGNKLEVINVNGNIALLKNKEL